MAEVRAVAAVIMQPGTHAVFMVKRPEDPADEFPGAWGLPAATVREGETPERAIERLGRDKLGLILRPQGELARGRQPRAAGDLEMILFETKTERWPPNLQEPGSDGATQYTDWAWAAPRRCGPPRSEARCARSCTLGIAG
ncbi:MAG: NUDIX domain-containing protein [Dehalococcoidia bacterium]|nr:NUDIX domain-containing protein [Dehalococcoidia bacterium]